MELKGIHHVSAITAHAADNCYFYTEVMGMRLVKKTVNQDAPSMYHLFYADEAGNPGTELTFFEIPRAGATHAGTNSISLTSLRVPSDGALQFWSERFKKYGVKHEAISERRGRKSIRFTDPEGQRLMLVSDETNVGVEGGVPQVHDEIPKEFGIVGLGPVTLTVANGVWTGDLIEKVLRFKPVATYPSAIDGQRDVVVYSTGEGGTGAELIIEERTDLPAERPGRGSVHHVALRAADKEELSQWIARLNEMNVPHSGFIDRFYFGSVYIKDPNGLTIELATDGPGFDTDEPFETMGESLALPPFLEPRRKEIERKLKPLGIGR
ncbi:ring-cleaving dioxygenase [Sporosarcina gallistercoris]|uniref:ring-cleaving dioxygenase n=1 Tax=Sporosarcina gallistercoris TaxID=2762245 RepID=UPI003D2E08C2